MISYKFPKYDRLLEIKKEETKFDFDEIKSRINKSKELLDEFYNDKNKTKKFAFLWKQYDPFSFIEPNDNYAKTNIFNNTKLFIAFCGKTYNITNAWIKCYELVKYYSLLSENTFHFDNAAFPGSFILATRHFCLSQTKYNYDWVGSSLITINELDSEPLYDSYKLWKNYPDKWLMSETNNGDVLVKENQLDFMKKLDHKVTLYTSDLGFDVSEDFSKQEIFQAPANIGQIVSGILTLKKGGCFVTKQYTYFEPITISVMLLISQLFDEFYVCKPYSSRAANSETYLVGKGFKSFDENHKYWDIVFEILSLNVNTNLSLFGKWEEFPEDYRKMIIESSNHIYNRQVEKINRAVKEIKENWNSKNVYGHGEKEQIKKWFIDNPISPVNLGLEIKMEDKFEQKKYLGFN
jgi:hypothetical protein